MLTMKNVAPRAVAALVFVCCLGTLEAQTPPATAPPPSLGAGDGAAVHELLPGIGKIGAQVALFFGGSANPYGLGRGSQWGGSIDLPLAKAPGGKLSYQILIGLSQAESDPFTITDSVAYVANLASGASREAALAGPPAAPFPVRREVTTRLNLLQVSPFSLKYTATRWDDARIRPFLGAGLDFLIVLTSEEPTRDESLVFTGTAPFDDPLLGGLIAQAPELTALGRPTGQGNLEVGGHASAGVEIRVSKGISLNLEYRYTATRGPKGRLQTATGAIGFHF
jgi:hypothetical protein